MFPSDKENVIEMMRTFYSSPAVSTNGSETIFEKNFKNCIEPPHTYADGFVFDIDSTVQGYGMIAKSYSTEYGRQCIWIEDIYVKEEYRGLGVGSLFLKYIKEQYPDGFFYCSGITSRKETHMATTRLMALHTPTKTVDENGKAIYKDIAYPLNWMIAEH